MSEKTLGRIAAEAHDRSLFGDDTPVPWGEPDSPAVVAWEAAGQAVAAHAASRLDGLMPMGLRFDDADPVAVCLVGDCKWHGHGDAMVDAVRAWTAHLAADHRNDWPED